jgi:transcriptional regulator GlxA family with amidase domain
MKIVILAPQGVQSLDVVGPAEVFWKAARRLGNADACQVQVMGVRDEPIRGTGALRFRPDRTINDPDEPIDTLRVTGDPSFQELDPAVSLWLAGRAPESRRYGSICTGNETIETLRRAASFVGRELRLALVSTDPPPQ